MKKPNFKLFVLISTIFLIQCTREAELDFPSNNFNTEKSQTLERIYYSDTQEKDNYVVTKNDAIALAQNYFNLESKHYQKGESTKIVKKIKELKDPATKETLIYIIEYEKGFCIFSADSRFDPMLAYSQDNDWGGESLEGPKIFLDIYKKRIKDIKAKKEKQSNELKSIWKKLSDTNIESSVSSESLRIIEPGCTWGECRPMYCDYFYYFNEVGPFVDSIACWSQIGSFSYYCPTNNGCDCDKSPAGCGAVALGMLMRFHEWPLMNMQFNGDAAYTDYDNMPRYRGSCANNSGGYKSSSMLVRLCGSAMNSIYGVLGTCNTATLPDNIGDGLDFFGYSHDGKGKLSDRYNAVINDLRNRYPVIMSGSKNAIGDDWHIWLADGYKEIENEHWIDNETCTDVYQGSDPYNCGVCPDCVTCYTYSSEQWHMNWGWNGASNGWYSISSQTIGDYDNLMRAYTNIRPN
jgi:hypothetical protein